MATFCITREELKDRIIRSLKSTAQLQGNTDSVACFSMVPGVLLPPPLSPPPSVRNIPLHYAKLFLTHPRNCC